MFRDALRALAEDFIERRRRGERPSISDYVRRYPALTVEIEDVFPTLMLLEEATSEDTADVSSGG